MNSKILFSLLVTIAAVAADERPSYSYPAPQSEETDEGYYKHSAESIKPSYNFGYNVENDFKHQESSDSGNTKGSYSVQLPDGRLQTVTYYVDGKNGYVAEVTYEGEARYPKSSESYEPSRSFESLEAPRYAPSRPSYAAPESEEASYEEPEDEDSGYAPPRPSYSAPESVEASFEEKQYRQPPRRYGGPDSE